MEYAEIQLLRFNPKVFVEKEWVEAWTKNPIKELRSYYKLNKSRMLYLNPSWQQDREIIFLLTPVKVEL